MKRAFSILTVLVIIISLSCTFLIAEESGERRERTREREVEERREAQQARKKEAMEERMEQRRMREQPERLYERLFAELERQREEIRALREEIADMRRMLEEQHAAMMPSRGGMRYGWRRGWAREQMLFRGRWEPERQDAQREIDMAIRETEEKVERHPDDLEVRMRLAHLYLEVERVEDAIHQYRAIQDIDPAFDPPYDALAELKHKFPHLFREREEQRESERREEWRPNIEGKIRELEEGVERHPDDIELRMKLARAYREAGKIEAAIMQYKVALEMRPDFAPPYKALKELGYRFPDEPRDRERPLEDSIGEVISTNEKEVKLKTREGETVVFRVPHRQKDDGSWVLNDDLSEMAKSLERSDQVKIVWQEVEGRRVIRRMERIKE